MYVRPDPPRKSGELAIVLSSARIRIGLRSLLLVDWIGDAGHSSLPERSVNSWRARPH